MQLLEPFGPGNPQPIFHDPAVTILDSRAVGRDSEHLQVTIRGKYANLKGIGFSLGNQIERCSKAAQKKYDLYSDHEQISRQRELAGKGY